MPKSILLVLLVCLSQPAIARMYQWIDPETGTTQLSGKPPVWYRSEKNGPRVFVFENGRLVDDTGIEVSDIEREKLRQQALIRAERDRRKAREKLLDAERLKALMDKEGQAAREEEEFVEYEPEPEDREQAGEEDAEEQQEQTAEAMRALIREWERMRTQQAREVIGTERSPPSSDM